MAVVTYAVQDGTALVTLNRPDQLNAINRPLLDELVASLERAHAAADVDIIVLQANGRAFCAGDDLLEFAGQLPTTEVTDAFVNRLQDVTRRIMLGPKPVVCAAQGWIVGAGAAWPLNADFAIVAEDATLFCPEAKYGLFPSGGATILLAERCGPAIANDVLWLGKRLDATALHAQRIVNNVVPRDRLVEETMALAARLRALPAASRARYKQARIEAISRALERALAFEAQYCKEAPFDPAVQERVAAALKR
jgi:2-(1,2-epoxy-1,2-dihydrophenyl)acetyl-CoA isomerase